MYVFFYLIVCYLSVCLFVCLSVPNDFANRWADIIILYRVASYRSKEDYNFFGGRVPPPF